MSLCQAAAGQLLLVDLQTRLSAAMPAGERGAAARAAAILLQAAAALAVPVLYSEQYPKGLGPTDAEVAARLPARARRFEKTGFSCRAAPGFSRALKAAGRGQVVLLGQEAHVCVLQTAFDLQEAGYAVFVVEEGVCSRDPAHKRNALERMARAGIAVTNVESVLFEWLADAAHPQFKALSALVR
jgi:nicotinamidase-related amidase